MIHINDIYSSSSSFYNQIDKTFIEGKRQVYQVGMTRNCFFLFSYLCTWFVHLMNPYSVTIWYVLLFLSKCCLSNLRKKRKEIDKHWGRKEIDKDLISALRFAYAKKLIMSHKISTLFILHNHFYTTSYISFFIL